MPRTTVTGAYDGGTYGALERVAEHVGAARGRAAAVLLAHRGAAGGAARRGARAADRVPGQRPAGGDAGRRGARLPATAGRWRRGGPRSSPTTTTAGARRPISRRRGSRWRRWSTRGRTWRCRRGRGAASPAATVVDTRGRRGLRAVRACGTAGSVERIAADCLAVAGGWNPTLHLTCHLGARPVWDEAIAAFVPAAGAVPGLTVAGAAAGAFSTHAALAGGAAAAAGGAGRSRDRGAGRRAAGGGGCARRVARRSGRCAAPGPRLARLPERRDGQGRGAGGAGELPLGRAHEALHHARDGDRPGQDRRRRRRWRCWRS